MRRLLVHVEGQTEEDFVEEILAPHLLGRGYSLVAARLMGSARGRDRRGGIRSWPAARRDIVHYVVMHEFEALLFSDCDGFARGVERPDLGSSSQAIANHFRKGSGAKRSS